jgi:hypothetical protein
MAMATFLRVYTGGYAGATDEELQQSAQAWGVWLGKLGPALVDPGNPTTPKAKRISSGGSIHDGPVGAAVTGYSILRADSLEAATDLTQDCPVLSGGGAVTVYETYEIQKMFAGAN